MKKTYFIVPVVAVLAFSLYYASRRDAIDAERRLEADRETIAKDATAKADREARKVAVDEALKNQRERKARADAAEAREKDASARRRAGAAAREDARTALDRAERRLKAIGDEIAGVETDTAKLKKAGDRSRAEAAHLRELVAKTEANLRALAALAAKPAAPATAVAAN